MFRELQYLWLGYDPIICAKPLWVAEQFYNGRTLELVEISNSREVDWIYPERVFNVLEIPRRTLTDFEFCNMFSGWIVVESGFARQMGSDPLPL